MPSIGFKVRSASYADIAPLRELLREEAGCQIVRDSILRRGLADPYAIEVNQRCVAYAGVWNLHYPGRVMEYYAPEAVRNQALDMLQEVFRASGATQMEAQTNMPHMAVLLRACTTDITEEKLLFEDGTSSALSCPGGVFRRRRAGDGGPDGEWVMELDGQVVAAGGVLDHYNPPYWDVYMEVSVRARRQGIGSYLVQELRRVCHDEGKKPAARCDPANVASAATLERGGLRPCGKLLVGKVDMGIW